jgi:hypothetical protein
MLHKKVTWVVAALVVSAGVVMAVLDPFSGAASGPGYVDNSYPTGITTIARETITSQTDVSATLGYSGSYNVNIANGTSSSSVEQAEASAQSAEQRVEDDEASLEQAERMEGTQGAASDLAATATLASDQQGLTRAEQQLTIDEETGCPAASSSNTTTPLNGSPSSSGNDNTSPGNNGSGNSNPGGTTGPTGSVGSKSAPDLPPATTSAPRVSAPTASASSPTEATFTGRVDPGGSSTSYYLEYGTTLAFGNRTPTESAGSGSGYVPVSTNVSGLSESTGYLFELVATNAKGTATSDPQSFTTATSSCAEQRQTVASDETVVTEAEDTLSADDASAGSSVTSATEQLESDEAAAASAEQALTQAQSTEANSRTTYTYLPAAGTLLTRGSTAYSLDGVKVPLFYGELTPWRALYTGVNDGPDVGQLNANLIALGYERGAPQSDAFTAATTAAVEAWQRAMGAPATGIVSLGDFVLAPGQLLVGSVSGVLGAAVQPGQTVFSATSNTPVVTIDLDPDEQSYVQMGDPVTVTLPDDENTPGVVSSVGKVAVGSSSNNNATGPTITVLVTLTHPAEAGGLDQASVNVAITSATAPNTLVVPVDALLALSGGGYALEEVSKSGVHTLVAANVGIFDDANGTVQVTGPGLAAGQRIVVPSL